jgi:hypothetical protein
MTWLKKFWWLIYYPFLVNYRKKRIWSILKTFFFLIGAYWTLIEFASFLLEKFQNINGTAPYKDALRNFVWDNLLYEFIIMGFISLVYNRQKLSESVKINNSDLVVEFKFCDLFEQKGAKVVAVMDTFDTDFRHNLVDKYTLHGKLIIKYYSGKEHLLDTEIRDSLSRTGFTPFEVNPNLRGKKEKYSIGTTVIIQPNNEYFYLTALTAMTETGNVTIQPEYLIDALANLWQFVPSYGKPMDIINIPIIGKSLNRLPPEYTHQKIAREIANSFITTSKQKTFCKKLRICIYPKDCDYINMKKLIEFVNHLKEYNFL